MKKVLFCILCYLLFVIHVNAQLRVSPLFSDNMVLQQHSDVVIWGTSKQNNRVQVVTSWNKMTYQTKSDSLGNWKVTVVTPVAGGPYSIKITDGQSIELDNVMIGEVWLCSGQSNMEMPVEGWGKVLNYQQEKKEANYFSNIRFLSIDKSTSPLPVNDPTVVGNGWQICSSESIANFSAAGYFFGRNLNKYLNVPIGLINVSWGGTYIESWMSNNTLATIPFMEKRLMQLKGLPLLKEERVKKFHLDIEDWKKKIKKIDKGYAKDIAVWAKIDFDDVDWNTMRMPGFVQKQGLKNFNGILWLRKSIEIPEAWQGRDLTLNLGTIDDNDCTFFNGVEIGQTEGWMVPRVYKIPGNLVKKGKNVIAIRIMDTGGLGGIGGNDDNILLSCTNKNVISISGEWLYNVSLNIKDIPNMPVNTATEPNIPSFLFNAMIYPLISYKIRGVIWYQGEANTSQAYQYRELMPLMIEDWRKYWGYNFPFYMVQLSNFTAKQLDPTESAWSELREAQMLTMHLQNTGMAVTIDIGEAFDIHPKNKQEVGRRLALIARAKTYSEKIAYSGPIYDSYRIEGNKIRIYFKHVNGGLKTINNEVLKGFTIAGVDRKFYWADAIIDGNSVVVSSPAVAFPLAVRYAWADNPICNLYNEDNLPASPFRTDDWLGITYVGK